MSVPYPTEMVDCPRCDGDGETYEADLFMGDGYQRCSYCFGAREVEVCAQCLDEFDGCPVCNPPDHHYERGSALPAPASPGSRVGGNETA